MCVCVCKRERERILLCWAPNEALSSLENQQEVYRQRETGGLGCWRQLGMRWWGKWVKKVVQSGLFLYVQGSGVWWTSEVRSPLYVFGFSPM